MIAYIKESVPISSDTKKLMKVMKEMKDPLHPVFRDGSLGGYKYSLFLPDGKPCSWFRKKVVKRDGKNVDILVYAYSIVPEGRNYNWTDIFIRICSEVEKHVMPIGDAVIAAEVRKNYPKQFKDTLKLTKAVRDKISRVSVERSYDNICGIIDLFSRTFGHKDWLSS